MKFLQLYRSASWSAALTALLLLSGNVSATQIDIGGFADNGTLTIMFEGIEQGLLGDPNMLEYPFPDDITSFSAAYDDDGLVGPLMWDLSDLGSLLDNPSTDILEALSVYNIFAFDSFELNVGSAVLNPLNYVEIYDPFFVLVASSQQFPGTGAVPLPGTLLLLSLGLLLLRRRFV